MTDVSHPNPTNKPGESMEYNDRLTFSLSKNMGRIAPGDLEQWFFSFLSKKDAFVSCHH